MSDLSKVTFQHHADLISTFLTGRYYNELYAIAKDASEHGGSSLTEIYARTVAQYTRDVQVNEKYLCDLIKDLHAYYGKYISGISLNDFVTRIVSSIIPREFLECSDSRGRDAILTNVLKRATAAVGKRALRPDMMKRIIDLRKVQIENETGAKILYEASLWTITQFKDELRAGLYAKKLESPGEKSAAHETIEKLRIEIRALLLEQIKAEQKWALQSEEFRATIRKQQEKIENLTRALQSFAPMSARTTALMSAPMTTQVAPMTAPVPAQVAPAPMQVAPMTAPVPAQVAPAPMQVAPMTAQVASVPMQVAPMPVQVAPMPAQVAPMPIQVAPMPIQVAPVPMQVAQVAPESTTAQVAPARVEESDDMCMREEGDEEDGYEGADDAEIDISQAVSRMIEQRKK